MGNAQGTGEMDEEVPNGEGDLLLQRNKRSAQRIEEQSGEHANSLSYLLAKTARLCWIDIEKIQTPPPPPRNSQGSCTVNSFLYIYGGRSPEGRLNDLWQFDCERREWCCLEKNNAPGGPIVRSGCLLVHDGDRHLYVGCGYDLNPNPHNETYKYDLFERRWSGPLEVRGDAVPRPRINFGSWFYDGCVWLFGGSPNGTNCYGDLWKFDTRTQVWSEPLTHGPMAPACQWCTCELWKNKVVFFGGHYDDGTPAGVFHLLDLETLEWQNLLELGMPKTGKSFGSQKNNNNAVGLELVDTQVRDLEQKQDPTWGELLCSSPASVIYRDNLILWGGWTGLDHRKDLWAVNLNTLTWDLIVPDTTFAPEASARGSSSAAMHNSTLFLFGGWNGWTQSNDVNAVSFLFPSLQRLCLEVISRNPTLSANFDYKPFVDVLGRT